MRKPITPTMHGVIDYSTVAAVAMLPRVLDFPPNARRLFDTLAAGYTGISSLTRYPLGVKKVIPFKAHGASEVAIGALLPAMPWLLGFSDHRGARNLCLGLTALTGVVALLTDWNGVESGNGVSAAQDMDDDSLFADETSERGMTAGRMNTVGMGDGGISTGGMTGAGTQQSGHRVDSVDRAGM